MAKIKRGRIVEVSKLDETYDSCALTSFDGRNGSIICNILKSGRHYGWMVSVPTGVYRKIETEWPVTVEKIKRELGIYKT